MSSSPKRILIVEDDPGLSLLFGTRLRQAGHDCATVDSARACIAWLDTHNPDLLLLDYSLPDMLAPAMVAALRTSGRLPPFIVVTGHGDERVAVEMMKLGARDYLMKDHTVFERLPGVVQRTLREVAQEQRLAAAETALQESETRLRRAELAGGFGHWELDLNRGLIRGSEGARRIYGLEGTEWLVAEVQQIPLPVWRNALAENLAQLIAGSGTYDLEFEIRRPSDGQITAVHSTATYDPAARTIFGVIHDISVRKQMEGSLQRTTALLEQTFAQSPTPMILVSLPDGVFRIINPACREFLGLGDEPRVGTPLAAFAPSYQDYDGAGHLARMESNPLAKALQGEKTFGAERRIVRQDGTVRWALANGVPIHDESGEIIAGCLTMVNITERKQAERDLEQFFELVPDLVCIASTDGFFKKLNNEWVRVLGYTKEELLARPFAELIHPEDRAATTETLTQQTAGSPITAFANRYRAKDGTYRWLEWNTTPAMANGELYAAARDITEWMHTVEALRESEEKFAKAFLNSPIPMALRDVASDRFIDVNDRCLSLMGYARKEVIDHSPMEIGWMAPEDREQNRQLLTDKGGVVDREIPLRRKDGTTVICSFSTQIVQVGGRPCVLSTSIDITERKRVEQALQENEERLRVTLETTQIGVWDWDLQNDRWYASPTYFTMLGYPPQTGPLNRDEWLDRIHPQDQAPVAARIATVLIGTEVQYEYEARLRHADGSYRWQQVRGNVVARDPGGRPTRLVGTRIDITERRVAEDSLRQKTALLEAQVNSTIDGILVVDDQGRKLLQNRRLAELWDIPTAIADHPDDQLQVRHVTQKTRNPEQFAAKVLQLYSHPAEISRDEVELADGRVLDRYSAPVLGQDGHYYGRIWTFRDITERRRAEAALRESEEKFAKVFHDAPVWIAITDLADSTYVDVNEEVLRRSGFARAEVIGHTAAELRWIAPEDRARVMQVLQEHERVENLEMMFRAKDGRPLHGLVSGERILIGGRPCLLTITVDITARKRAEEIIAWEAALMENSSDICCIKDLDLRLLAVNSAFLRAAGAQSAAAVIGKTDAEIFTQLGNAAHAAAYMDDERRAQTLHPGQTIVREEARIEPEGTTSIMLTRKFPVFDSSGRLIATANISTDVTAHRRLEEALQANERRYRLLFAANVAGVALHEIVVDASGRPCDYRFLEVNLAFEKLTGRQSADLVGRTVLEVMPQTEPVWIERYGRVALTGKSEHFEDSSRQLDRYFEVSAYSPQHGQFAVLILDITLRRRAEEALKQSLHEKEALLKEVHHRVKNNLQVISSLLRLEGGQSKDTATTTGLQNMQERVRAMALLHENLYRSGNLAEVDMAIYLRAVCQQLLRSGAALTGGLIDLRLELAPLRLEMNQALPCGLLVNELVSNCLKHAFPDGRSGRIRVGLQPAAKEAQWCLRVEDDGIGLPAGFALGQLRSLGLQLVSDLSQQIQGRLEFAIGPGACFSITFAPQMPIAVPASEPGASSDSPP